MLIALASLAAGSTSRIAAQQPVFVGSELDHYTRLLELTGRLRGAPLVFRPVSWRHVGTSLRSDSAHPWEARYPLRRDARPASGVRVTPLEPVAHSVYQSGYPRLVNDGALWAGKGISGELRAGALASRGPLSVTLYPTVYTTANRSFDFLEVNHSARSIYSYPWSDKIDWPQRFGADPITEVDWGQSSVRLDLAGFTAGLTTENMWWGPAAMHPILMSNTAPGFPHIDLGTGRPVTTPIGRVETRFVWGQLRESRYFDPDPSNDRRFFVGLTAAWEPRWVPGLSLGAGRVFYMPWDSVDVGDLAIVLQSDFDDPGGRDLPLPDEDDKDQMFSLYARWVFPKDGFEVYGEWARNEVIGNLRQFLLEPEHGLAYMLGFQKALGSATHLWRLVGEITHLEGPRTTQVRPYQPFYSHTVVTQGYTHKGQLIGAGIGRSAGSQFLGIDRYDAGGRWGLFAQRVRYDTDDYVRRFGPTRVQLGHDVELTAGVTALRFLGAFDVAGTLALSRELNRHATVGNDLTNLRGELTVRWRVP